MTLYVSKSGNDANAGTSAAPKLTIASAVSAAQAADTIDIGDGEFEEQIDLPTASKSLNIQGAGASDTTLSNTSGATIILTNGCTVRSLTSTSSDAVTGQAVSASSKANCLVADCVLVGIFDGLIAASSTNFTLRNCNITGDYDGVNVGGATGFLIEDCQITSTCNFGTPDIEFSALVATPNTTTGTVRNTTLTITRTNDAGGGTSNTLGFNSRGKVLLINVDISASATNASYQGDVVGVTHASFLSSTKLIQMIGGSIRTSNAGSGACYDVLSSNGVTALVNVDYDADKVSGSNIIDVQVAGGVLGSHAVGSTYTATYTNTISGFTPNQLLANGVVTSGTVGGGNVSWTIDRTGFVELKMKDSSSGTEIIIDYVDAIAWPPLTGKLNTGLRRGLLRGMLRR